MDQDKKLQKLQEKYKELLNRVGGRINVAKTGEELEKATCPCSECPMQGKDVINDAQDSFIRKVANRIDSHAKYVTEMLIAHGIDCPIIDIVDYHYRTVAKHFTLHTLEDAAEIAEEHDNHYLADEFRELFEKLREEEDA